jgi:hypothetical protein
MALETGGIIALVAGSSVLAALVTQGAGLVRDWYHRRTDGAYAALYLAIALESYANECSTCIGESEDHESSDGNAGSPHGNIPELPDYPPTIEWKPFGIDRTTKAMSFRVEVETTKAMISGHWDFLDEDDVLPMMREEAARLGLKALSLAIEFREAWKIAPVAYDDEWNVRSFLERKLTHYEELKVKRHEASRKLMEELSRIEPDGATTE